MAFIKYCKKCKSRANFIKNGKLKLKDGSCAQRIKCLNCNGTYTHQNRHEFFRLMKKPIILFNSAIKMRSEGCKITEISKKLKIRKNTIIDWIRKVKNNRWSYKLHLITHNKYSPVDADKLISNLSWYQKHKRKLRIIKLNKSRAKN